MIKVVKKNNVISLTVGIDIINTSNQFFDLEIFKATIFKQLTSVYNNIIGKYKLELNLHLRILNHKYQCSPKNILFQIVDTTPNNNVAIADFKGMRVKLNKSYIDDFITNKNCRTLPHELGHLLGLNHPHANAKFESINLDSHLLEQQLTEAERQCNLMSQSWYAQKANAPLADAMQLTEKQIELISLNYNTKSLNKNYHLKYFLWWKKIL
jgi:predicted Zn-dependent protease